MCHQKLLHAYSTYILSILSQCFPPVTVTLARITVIPVLSRANSEEKGGNYPEGERTGKPLATGCVAKDHTTALFHNTR